ncbi:Hydroxyethylthiazole kinase [Apilactobacillus kunkeei]|nr:Hydroxyethylthiazole kinase [Apilactobacillus kunkeei]CAI2551885.1 Hydroxyethylthiazole kinase [Apilactobacillus kunkeei]CAI2552048.1 Hydroxyethylthiazole kinase [Apilactobacillus kunkeei]CAI2552200.1 Hydroxyethylthiazole kinase [Apilactobacillus kunkeei]CAI2552225.1 Hydroxyethylthiazole kinase [Apilactobacillus kunkeei]
MTTIKQIRENSPIILNISNMVTPQHVADAINFIGASPIMFDDIKEASDLVNISNALVINMGSSNDADVEKSISAGKYANQKGIPVVIDPVAIGASKLRQNNFAKVAKEVKFEGVRGNAGELAFLADIEWNAQGIDAGNGDGDLHQIAETVAKKFDCITLLSGVTDVISDGSKTVEVKNGHHYFAVNVGCGDMLDGILGACLAVDNSLDSAVLASSILSIAGEIAGGITDNLPYSFLSTVFNTLYQLTDEEINEFQKLS